MMGCSSGDGTGYNRVGEIPCLILGAGVLEKHKEMTNLVDSILELEKQIGERKLERNFQDVYQPDTRKLDTAQA
jgi:hypothetical protein